MSGFPILDLILGLVFIFFILSIIASSLVEVIMTRRKIRSKVLTQWLLTIFDKKVMQPDGKIVKMGQAIMDHCLTTALAKPGQATSYMEAKNFVSALLEKMSFDPQNPEKIFDNLDDLLGIIRDAKALDGTHILSTELQRTILIFGNEAKIAAAAATVPGQPATDELQVFRHKLETWFDSNMERITGRMKSKHVRPMTFWMAIVVVVFMNADTIRIGEYFYDHPAAATIFAERAQEEAEQIQSLDTSGTVTATDKLEQVATTLDDMAPDGLPLGWEKVDLPWNDANKALPDGDPRKTTFGKIILSHIVGWVVSIMAIMLGAPFWFDLLNKISNIRGSGNKPTATAALPVPGADPRAGA